jgi:hypothetical protein
MGFCAVLVRLGLHNSKYIAHRGNITCDQTIPRLSIHIPASDMDGTPARWIDIDMANLERVELRNCAEEGTIDLIIHLRDYKEEGYLFLLDMGKHKEPGTIIFRVISDEVGAITEELAMGRKRRRERLDQVLTKSRVSTSSDIYVGTVPVQHQGERSAMKDDRAITFHQFQRNLMNVEPPQSKGRLIDQMNSDLPSIEVLNSDWKKSDKHTTVDKTPTKATVKPKEITQTPTSVMVKDIYDFEFKSDVSDEPKQKFTAKRKVAPNGKGMSAPGKKARVALKRAAGGKKSGGKKSSEFVIESDDGHILKVPSTSNPSLRAGPTASRAAPPPRTGKPKISNTAANAKGVPKKRAVRVKKTPMAAKKTPAETASTKRLANNSEGRPDMSSDEQPAHKKTKGDGAEPSVRKSARIENIRPRDFKIDSTTPEAAIAEAQGPPKTPRNISPLEEPLKKIATLPEPSCEMLTTKPQVKSQDAEQSLEQKGTLVRYSMNNPINIHGTPLPDARKREVVEQSDGPLETAAVREAKYNAFRSSPDGDVVSENARIDSIPAVEDVPELTMDVPDDEEEWSSAIYDDGSQGDLYRLSKSREPTATYCSPPVSRDDEDWIADGARAGAVRFGNPVLVRPRRVSSSSEATTFQKLTNAGDGSSLPKLPPSQKDVEVANVGGVGGIRATKLSVEPLERSRGSRRLDILSRAPPHTLSPIVGTSSIFSRVGGSKKRDGDSYATAIDLESTPSTETPLDETSDQVDTTTFALSGSRRVKRAEPLNPSKKRYQPFQLSEIAARKKVGARSNEKVQRKAETKVVLGSPFQSKPAAVRTFF